jgi:hypothetical protein
MSDKDLCSKVSILPAEFPFQTFAKVTDFISHVESGDGPREGTALTTTRAGNALRLQKCDGKVASRWRPRFPQADNGGMV